MLIATGAPPGVVVRAQLGERAVLLIPDAQPDSIRAIASGILGEPELAELDKHLEQLAGVARLPNVPTVM